MAISIGKKSEESVQSFTKYIGVAPVFVLAVNPNKDKLQELRGFSPQEEPVYVYEKDGVKYNNLTFVIKTDSSFGNGIETTELIKFFCTNEVRRTRDGEKVRVIDKYGESMWVTKDEYKNQVKKNRVIPPFKPCHKGEEELIAFLKAWLNVDDSTTWDKDNKVWNPVSDLSKAECSLDWEKLISGNITELSGYIKAVPDYEVKVCFGIKTTEDNRHYTEIFNRFFLKNASGAYYKFDNEIKNLKDVGMYPNTEFSTAMLHEWNLDKTVFEKTVTATPEGSDIFGNALGIPEATVEVQIETPEKKVEKTEEPKDEFDDLPF